MEEAAILYPVTLEVDYPERQSRWKTLFRLFLALPVFIFLAILSGGAFSWLGGRWWSAAGESPIQTYTFSVGAGGAIILAIWVAVAVRGYIPHWLFNFQVALMRFQVRAYGYFALLTDVYPPFEGDYPIRLEVEYPRRLSRWKVLFWKLITSIPHFLVLFFLYLAALLCVFVAWLVILFSGRCPREIHQFIAGVMRWSLRVQGYVVSLTDEYPPFSLAADSGPAGKDTYAVASIIGGLLALAFVGGLAAFAAFIARGLPAEKVEVSYSNLAAGRIDPTSTTVDLWDSEVALQSVADPANELVAVVIPRPEERLVSLVLTIKSKDVSRVRIRESDFRLKDANGHSHKPVIATANGATLPFDMGSNDSAAIIAVFEISGDGPPAQLRWARPFLESFSRPVVYEFE
jgi:hypothetical protein